MTPEERNVFVLGQLSTSLQTEWSQIEALEKNLEALLQDGRARANARIPAEKRAEWDRAWDEIHRHLAAMRASAAEARRRYYAGEHAEAVESWKDLTGHDEALEALMEGVCVTGREAVVPMGNSDPWDDSWKLLWLGINEHLSTLRMHIVATRFRLGLRKGLGDERSDALTKEILERLPPGSTLAQAERFAAEYRQAHGTLEDHRDHPTFRDIIRSLFLMPEESAEDHLRNQREAGVRKH